MSHGKRLRVRCGRMSATEYQAMQHGRIKHLARMSEEEYNDLWRIEENDRHEQSKMGVLKRR